MIGMVFFGKKSKHIEKMEEEGHHIHEASVSMWVPYGILAVLTIGIGIIGLSAEEGIHHLFEEYLEHSLWYSQCTCCSRSINLTWILTRT